MISATPGQSEIDFIDDDGVVDVQYTSLQTVPCVLACSAIPQYCYSLPNVLY